MNNGKEGNGVIDMMDTDKDVKKKITTTDRKKGSGKKGSPKSPQKKKSKYQKNVPKVTPEVKVKEKGDHSVHYLKQAPKPFKTNEQFMSEADNVRFKMMGNRFATPTKEEARNKAAFTKTDKFQRLLCHLHFFK